MLAKRSKENNSERSIYTPSIFVILDQGDMHTYHNYNQSQKVVLLNLTWNILQYLAEDDGPILIWTYGRSR